jgi:hypothetical protein
MRIGVLDDTKWNANRLLRKTAARQPGSARRSRRVPTLYDQPDPGGASVS